MTIFAEYWIRCSRCKGEKCLGEETRAAASVEATRLGWKKINSRWVCPDCQK